VRILKAVVILGALLILAGLGLLLTQALVPQSGEGRATSVPEVLRATGRVHAVVASSSGGYLVVLDGAPAGTQELLVLDRGGRLERRWQLDPAHAVPSAVDRSGP
jgi:hypothetical protein